MQTFFSELLALGTPAGFLALANIILIDVIMSGDNAILIGMAVQKLQGKQRRRAIFFGIALATLLRVVFAASTTILLGITGLKLAGGILLLYVVWKFYRELRSSAHSSHTTNAHVRTGLLAAIWTILIADVSMSLDNVLAVAGASHGNFVALGIGLVVSIILMAFASGIVARLLDKNSWIQWVGLVVILFVAVEMMMSGSGEVSDRFGGLPILPSIVLLSCFVFSFLHTRFIRPADETKIRGWLMQHYVLLLAGAVIIFTFLLMFGADISDWFSRHLPVRYALLFILLTILLELLALARSRRS